VENVRQGRGLGEKQSGCDSVSGMPCQMIPEDDNMRWWKECSQFKTVSVHFREVWTIEMEGKMASKTPLKRPL